MSFRTVKTSRTDSHRFSNLDKLSHLSTKSQDPKYTNQFVFVSGISSSLRAFYVNGRASCHPDWSNEKKKKSPICQCPEHECKSHLTRTYRRPSISVPISHCPRKTHGSMTTIWKSSMKIIAAQKRMSFGQKKGSHWRLILQTPAFWIQFTDNGRARQYCNTEDMWGTKREASFWNPTHCVGAIWTQHFWYIR